MPRKPQPLTETYGLDALHIFPYYSTQEEWEAAHPGRKCPTYRDELFPKYWEGTVAADADPDLTIRFNVPYNSRGGVNTNPDGTPNFSLLDLTPEEIVSVNIPKKAVSQWPGNTRAVERQPPCYDLLPTEKLVFQNGIARAQLMILRALMPGAPTAQAGGGFTEADRMILKAIAGRMGL